MKGRVSLGLAALLLQGGCGNDCGTYQYKGVLGTEWCGDVYGSEGTLIEGEPEFASAEVQFRHTVPPGEFYFDHFGSVRAKFLWSDLDSGEAFGADRVFAECVWTDRGDPRTDSDDVERREPPVEIELRGHGGGFNLDPSNSTVRELSWHVVCGDNVFRLDARDRVKFDHLCCAESLDRELADWLAD